jgi:hypothetical protein
LAVTSTQTGALLPPSNVPVIKATSGSIGQPGPSATQPVTSTIAIPGQSTMSPQAALTTSTQMSTNPSTNPSAATSRQSQQSSLSTTVPSFYASFRTVIASSVAGSANVLELISLHRLAPPPLCLGRQRSPLCRSPCLRLLPQCLQLLPGPFWQLQMRHPPRLLTLSRGLRLCVPRCSSCATVIPYAPRSTGSGNRKETLTLA